ncbi:hypothetical protein FQZ97_826760 [compost metagenome]
MSTGVAGSCSSPRARSSTLPISLFISSMSRSSRSSSAALGCVLSISSASRMRASGVRRSCDTPASSMVRADSRSRTCTAMVLKRRLSATISRGPVSGSNAGASPCPSWALACSSRASGATTRRASSSASPTATASPAARPMSNTASGRLLMRALDSPTASVPPPVGTRAQYQSRPASSVARIRCLSSPTRPARAASSR